MPASSAMNNNQVSESDSVATSTQQNSTMPTTQPSTGATLPTNSPPSTSQQQLLANEQPLPTQSLQQANAVQKSPLRSSQPGPSAQPNNSNTAQAQRSTTSVTITPGSGLGKQRKRTAPGSGTAKRPATMVEMEEQLALLNKKIELAKCQLKLKQLQINEDVQPQASAQNEASHSITPNPFVSRLQQEANGNVMRSSQEVNGNVVPSANQASGSVVQPPHGANGSMIQPTSTSSSLFASTQYLAASNLYKVFGFKGKTPEEVDAWFRELHNLKEQLKTSDEEIMRMFGQWIANDDFIRWWRQIAPEIKTLAEAQRELRTVCGDNTPSHIALMKALRIHQKWDERVDKFILSQREHLSRVYPRFSDQHLPNLLWQGLSHPIKTEVKMRAGMSMQEFLEECRTAEAVVRARQNSPYKRQSTSKGNSEEKWCESCEKNTHNTESCWSKKNGKNQAAKRSNKRSANPEEKSDGKKAKIECFICKGPHLASQCTNK